MLLMVGKLKLADVRAELRITQDELAKSAKLAKRTIVQAEKGENVQRISAHAILTALNIYRMRDGKEALLLNEVDIHIKGASPGD